MATLIEEGKPAIITHLSASRRPSLHGAFWIIEGRRLTTIMRCEVDFMD
jgi:hypothetical protein